MILSFIVPQTPLIIIIIIPPCPPSPNTPRLLHIPRFHLHEGIGRSNPTVEAPLVQAGVRDHPYHAISPVRRRSVRRPESHGVRLASDADTRELQRHARAEARVELPGGEDGARGRDIGVLDRPVLDASGGRAGKPVEERRCRQDRRAPRREAAGQRIAAAASLPERVRDGDDVGTARGGAGGCRRVELRTDGDSMFRCISSELARCN